MKIHKKIIYTILGSILVFSPGLVFAADDNTSSVAHDKMLSKLKKVGGNGGYNLDVSPAQIVGTIISTLISFLGLIFIVLAIVAGYRWMTADGNEDQVKKAQTTLKEAVIGLIISISVWTLWNFIFESLIVKK